MVVNGDVVAFASKEAWEAWLVTEYARSDGVWLKIAKKSSAVDSVTYAEALVGTPYGWWFGGPLPGGEPMFTDSGPAPDPSRTAVIGWPKSRPSR